MSLPLFVKTLKLLNLKIIEARFNLAAKFSNYFLVIELAKATAIPLLPI